jgi:hypothetical protein
MSYFNDSMIRNVRLAVCYQRCPAVCKMFCNHEFHITHLCNHKRDIGDCLLADAQIGCFQGRLFVLPDSEAAMLANKQIRDCRRAAALMVERDQKEPRARKQNRKISLFRLIIDNPFHPRSSRAITGVLVSAIAGLITISAAIQIYRHVAGR